MPSSPRVPVNPTPYPEPKRERAKHYQLEAIAEMSVWEGFYNYDRPHDAHSGKTPYEVLREKLR
jgi:hypothetical protein